MARRIARPAREAIRDHLVAEHDHAIGRYAKRLGLPDPHRDTITNGAAVRLHRYELPDDHPARSDGDPADSLTLTADDELLPDPDARQRVTTAVTAVVTPAAPTSVDRSNH
ncbi:hypothetical protein [Nocardia camponoti]|uniref:Uncharacterized protein n=1 Tax=Nocardia camponoti TaxID=1616106 RepID=A0A917QFW9_9NOCA|nr:hypothetical protein [Nocardia camponoti]GGK48477.1 hypothetical protein GCM10011591_19830 [Nocardia camponoti]